MWTPTALASEARRLGGIVWRVVEYQYTASTRKLVDTADEQAVLEELLEVAKPPYPAGTEHLHYLLKTPFRYYPPRTHGSRFRRPMAGEGVYYASEHVRTALAEIAYYRIRFFQASPGTPLPKNEERLSVFSVEYGTERGLDLTEPLLNRDRASWTHPIDYTATQQLADAARAAGVDALRYESVRDVEQGANVALLEPRGFTLPQPVSMQTWYLYLGEAEINCTRSHATAAEDRWTFPREHFITP